ncbi:IclR family transcriptional regulator [Pandoraea sp. XJJ-1]|uniref:IclR family transcriptional regulator n=1 Tax=Pandoraea sp. XJJ-1 TaxID=3002643 RepID=UPI00227F5F38|nr:IclR family transcriptional regulator [Pandoraea sp. XJJ-1]WAL81833.1 IclR family transcriptional regulator [Pandoraea sp. XJJ-1]
MSDVVRSAARVLDMLEYFAGLHGSATLATVTTVFGMPKSSAFGLLRTLCARGYLVRDEQGQYTLNAYFREHGFGWGGDYVARWSALIEPVMERLAMELGETVSLGRLHDDGQVRLLKQALTNQPIRYEARVNGSYPAYCSAMGRVLLSMVSETHRERVLSACTFEALTPMTVTDPLKVREIIRQAGQDGYCVLMDESDLGGTGVATWLSVAPTLPIVALNVSCISARFPEKRERVIAALLREATQLRAAMGN